IGNSFNRQQQARQLNATLNLKAVHPNHRPKVALLMGMPGGSFLTGTKHSYVGDLINRAGGTVIGAGNGAYTTMNVEQIAAAQPDVIITMAHAMPKQVFQSFDELFTQPAWQALPAIKQHQVYQASEPTFGMTANLNAPAAFKQLKTWLQTN
ncbi:MAG: ABC transporter substrate-binding protein, partial [Weissella cibaria]